ncbi:MAG: hypothetical protein U9N59_03150, partial [Campylobacterota bacterium]|nr:hypothetical protein [Campylobacterota bacterium]
AWMDDATLTSQYMNVWPLTADGATLDFDLSGTKSDTTANAPHITANNLPFMINEAKSQSPSFAYQLNLDDNSKVDDATQYRGLSQFALWFLRPSTIRQASAESTTESQEPLFKELADSVELIHYNTELAEFWRSGELVGSGESDLNANIPEQYKNDPRWFLLDTDANPPRPWAEDAEIAVWAFALVKGEAPNREWLVYVQSPSGDKSDVTVTIPEYKDVLVDSRVEGNFFILSENSEDKIDITNTTISETKEFLPIFPNAEGPGTTTPGGRNGRIIEVTSLYHSGSGSLREAVETKGPRIIIFKVSGIIDLEDKPIIVKEPYLTIAGQTAPEGGITLKGHQISIQTHDVVIRYIKSRPGSSTMETDAINIGTGAHNVVIDHCSLSWSMDEAGDVWSGISDPIHDVTWSWNLYGEGLGNHSCAQLTGSNSDVENMTDIVFHHNVFINFRHRMPLIKVKSSKLINNIMYNWGWWGTAISGGVIVDIIGNKYHTGENLESDWHPRAIVIRTDKTIADEGLTGDPDRGPSGKPSIYIAKNHGLLKYGSGDWRQTVNNNIDNWDMLVEYSYEKGWPLIDRIYQRNIPMNTYKNPITVHDAAKLDEILLKEVGASKRLNEKGEWITSRDTIDTRIIDDYKNRTGKRINHQDEVGGYISVNNGNGYLDTDHDGMPDVWENIYSLNPLSSVDQNSDNDNDGYTNIEEFLNGTHPNL